MLSSEVSQIVHTTMEDHLRGAIDMTMRFRPVMAIVRRRGGLKFRQSGAELTWRPKFALPEAQAYTGGALQFEPSDKYRTANIDWKSVTVTDTIDEKDTLMNRGNAAIIDRYADIAPDMVEALQNQFDDGIYNNDGTYPNLPSGLESMFADDGNTVVADIIAKPDDTYAGLSTTPGAIRGSWSSNLTTPPNATINNDWPLGTGDTEYGFWSPKLFNWGSTSWGTGSNLWEDNCTRVIRRSYLTCKLHDGPTAKANYCLMNEELFYQYENRLEPKQRIQVRSNSEAYELGFTEALQQEGVTVMTAYGVPASTAYMLNFSKIQLRCMYDALYKQHGPENDIRTLSTLWVIAFFGNWKYESPKWFAKLYPYAQS